MKSKKDFKIENGKLYVTEREPLTTKDAGPCSYCKRPVYVSEGQLLKYRNGEPTHKKCRT